MTVWYAYDFIIYWYFLPLERILWLEQQLTFAQMQVILLMTADMFCLMYSFLLCWNSLFTPVVGSFAIDQNSLKSNYCQAFIITKQH